VSSLGNEYFYSRDEILLLSLRKELDERCKSSSKGYSVLEAFSVCSVMCKD